MRVEEIAELDSLYQQLLKLNDDIKAEKVLNENYCGVAGEFLHILRGKGIYGAMWITAAVLLSIRPSAKQKDVFWTGIRPMVL